MKSKEKINVKEKFIDAIILLVVLLILNFFISREFRTDAKGACIKMWNNIYRFVETRKATSIELSKKHKELSTYKSDWNVEKVEAVKTVRGGLEWKIEAQNTVSGDAVTYATPNLITIPNDLRYTIMLGDPDRKEKIPLIPVKPFVYEIR